MTYSPVSLGVAQMLTAKDNREPQVVPKPAGLFRFREKFVQLEEEQKEEAVPDWAVQCIVLHELSSERDLISAVKEFFENVSPPSLRSHVANRPAQAKDGSMLLLQCDPLAASLRRIEHAKYVCENTRARHYERLVTEIGGKGEKPAEAEDGAEGEGQKQKQMRMCVQQARVAVHSCRCSAPWTIQPWSTGCLPCPSTAIRGSCLCLRL